MLPHPSYCASWSVHLIAAGLVNVLLIAAPIGGQSAHAQSFDCRYARFSDEKTICRDPTLGQLDEDLASVYRRVLLSLARPERDQLDKAEDAFVRARHRCGDHRTCIEEMYRKRLQELQAALSQADDGRNARFKRLREEDGDRNGSAIDPQERRNGWVNPPRSR